MHQQLRTLAYTKSPKTSTRTTFQDELQAAVSARADRVVMDQYSSNDFEDEDDFLNELLKSRKKKTETLKKSKGKTVNFAFSDEEDKLVTSKRVSFLKNKNITQEGNLIEVTNKDPHPRHSLDGDGDHNPFPSKYLTHSDESDENTSVLESTRSQDTQENANRFVSPPPEDALDDKIPLVPDTSEDNAVPAAPKKELPTPKPRQRVPTRSNQEQINANFSEAPNNRSNSLSSTGEHSILTKSTLDSESKNGFTSEDIENPCISLEELSAPQQQTTLGEPGDLTDCATKHNVPVSENWHDTLVSASRTKGGRSVRPVQSKYLGSLRVLDCTISLHEAQESQEADSLRAAVYQEWMKKKQGSLKQNMEMKKKEFSVKEKQKKDQEAKREEAEASYEAWKESKRESLKEKHKEQQERIRKEQSAREEKEEKRQSSKQVFDQWKRERDILLKEKHRRKTKEETKQELQKQEKEKDRRKANYSAFTEWNEKKKNLLHERAIEKRKELNNTVRAERSLKEEKDKMALDMYESWLAKKTIENQRHKEESWFQGILDDGNTPPPWSPPNKTIPRGKK